MELNLYLNGKSMHCPASGIRGTVFPIVYGELCIVSLSMTDKGHHDFCYICTFFLDIGISWSLLEQVDLFGGHFGEGLKDVTYHPQILKLP